MSKYEGQVFISSKEEQMVVDANISLLGVTFPQTPNEAVGLPAIYQSFDTDPKRRLTALLPT